jgi:hypothetical protein
MALVKAAQIARRYGLGRHAVGAWIRRGLVPESIVTRIGGSVLIDDEQLTILIRDGKIFRRPRRARAMNSSAEDNFTTQRIANRTEHRWTSETGSVQIDHPFSPEMIGKVR